MSGLLFSPYKMRGLTLENRIVLSPMCQYASRNGNASNWHMVHLGQYALSGVGLLITEATAVEPEGRISPYCLGLYSDENAEALRPVIEFCKEFGAAKFGVQLAHAGRKASVPPSFQIRRPLGPDEGGWVPLSPSYYEDGIHPNPRIMDHADIARTIESWRQATIRAARIGVDMIEMHFAHGYLINEFLSPLINRREDEYGGSRENRMRLALETFKACRAVWPEDRPMGVRVSAVDWVEGGWNLDDTVALSRELKALGCDYICTSSGGVSLAQKIEAAPLYQVPFAARVREEAGIASMAVGQITEHEQAEEILRSGKADLVAIARRLLYNPRWAWHAAFEMGEMTKYPPRYRVCHPKMGADLNFTDTAEKRKKLEAMFQEEARYAAKIAGST